MKFAAAAGLAAVTGAVPAVGAASAAGDETRSELLVVGPFPLGKLYQNMDDKPEIGEELFKRQGLKDADLVKALNGCVLYAIDKRAKAKGASWRFVGPTEGFPQLAAAGKLSIGVRGKGDRKFELQIAELEPRGAQTVTGKKPTRDFGLLVQLRILSSGAAAPRPFKYNLIIRPRIKYDIEGRLV